MMTKFAISTAVAVTAMAAMPTAAQAQYRSGYYDNYGNYYANYDGRYDRRYANRYRDGRYNSRYYDQRYRGHYGRRCSGSTGTIVGAIAGGLLGREVAGRGDRTVGAIIGGAAGALAGRAIDRSDCRRLSIWARIGSDPRHITVPRVAYRGRGRSSFGMAGLCVLVRRKRDFQSRSNNAASCSIIVPPNCSASMIVTARL